MSECSSTPFKIPQPNMKTKRPTTGWMRKAIHVANPKIISAMKTMVFQLIPWIWIASKPRFDISQVMP